MGIERMPLFPQARPACCAPPCPQYPPCPRPCPPPYPPCPPRGEACMRIPLFQAPCPPRPEPCGEFGRGDAQRVCVSNPLNPCERVELCLSVDECGCLNICVHRDPMPPSCPMPRRRHHHGGCLPC